MVDRVLQVYPSVDDNDFLSVYAGRYTGLIPISDYEMLDVRPRVPVKNLTHNANSEGKAS